MKKNRQIFTIELFGSLDLTTPEEKLKNNFSGLTNFYAKDAVMRKRYGSAILGSALGAGTITMLKAANLGATEKLFRMTSGGAVEEYTSDWGTSVATGKANSTVWQLIEFMQKGATEEDAPTNVIVFTDGTNVPFYWDGSSASNIDTSGSYYPKTARFVTELDGYLIAARITNDADEAFPERLRYSNIRDLNTWGELDWESMAGTITGLRKFNNSVYVWTETGISSLTPSGNLDAPFTIQRDLVPYGLADGDANSIIEYGNMLFYKCIDGTIRMFNGFRAIPISDPIRTFVNTAAITNAGYDPVEANILFATPAESTNILALDVGMDGDEVSLLMWAKENYPADINSFALYSGNLYGATSTKVIKLHDSASTQDEPTTNISGTMTTGVYRFGDRMEGKIGRVRLYAKPGSGSATITGTIHLTDSNDNITINHSVNESGADIEVSKWSKGIKFTLAAAENKAVDIYKIEIELVNSRLY